jgi:hypothetical protein
MRNQPPLYTVAGSLQAENGYCWREFKPVGRKRGGEALVSEDSLLERVTQLPRNATFRRRTSPEPQSRCRPICVNPQAVRAKGGPCPITSTDNSLNLCEDFVRIVLAGQ